MKTGFLWIQRALLTCAFGAIGYCGYVLGDTWLFQEEENFALTQALAEVPAGSALPPLSDGLVGRIEIARLGVSVIVTEGTSSKTLRRAAGHIEGTSLPGQPGNIGISAHRDTFFRPLRNIRTDDVVKLTTLAGAYEYRVVSTKIVKPEDVTVLAASGSEVLTLVTCYPFYFVGSAPERFIVRAERVGI